MKKKVIISTFAIAAMALTTFTGYKTFGLKKTMADIILDENIEALTQGETEQKYAICYWESKVARGYTYYDCGKCEKIYDERGKGTYSKCFY
jgi:hypothetical protein